MMQVQKAVGLPCFIMMCGTSGSYHRDAGNSEVPHSHPPSVLIHHDQSAGPFPKITTGSGKVVKPVQWYGAETCGGRTVMADRLILLL